MLRPLLFAGLCALAGARERKSELRERRHASSGCRGLGCTRKLSAKLQEVQPDDASYPSIQYLANNESPGSFSWGAVPDDSDASKTTSYLTRVLNQHIPQ